MLQIIGLIVTIELLSIVFFWLLAKYNASTITLNSVLKGIFERFFVAYSLYLGYPQILTLFAALKIATRIKDESKISNDYYFIGNLISISLAIIYTELIKSYIL
jgi:hypothetical protein